MRYALALGAMLAVGSTAAASAQSLSPRTLLPLHVACADEPVATLPTPQLTIAGAERADGRRVLGPGDVVVIKAGTAMGIAVGQSFLARRVEGGGRDAFRRGRDGYAGIRTAGILTVTAVDEQFALARIERACDYVLVGDYLEPLVLPALPVVEKAGPPDFGDRGRVLFGPDLRTVFADGDLLAIDRGAIHGVAPGTRFALYRDPSNGLPLTELGEAVVIETGETASRAVIVRVLDVVTAGDVAVRRQP
jgi:hypothetical protein